MKILLLIALTLIASACHQSDVKPKKATTTIYFKVTSVDSDGMMEDSKTLSIQE